MRRTQASQAYPAVCAGTRLQLPPSTQHRGRAGVQQHALHRVQPQGQPAAALDLYVKGEAAGAGGHDGRDVRALLVHVHDHLGQQPLQLRLPLRLAHAARCMDNKGDETAGAGQQCTFAQHKGTAAAGSNDSPTANGRAALC